jgi:hypothetical protein
MTTSAKDFLKNHRLRSSDIHPDDLVRIFTGDMNLGLKGREGALRMIPTYIEADNDFITDGWSSSPILQRGSGERS